MKIVRPVMLAALLIAHSSAQAASFDCSKGRSLTEKMICNDPALSRLDDTLGQLYWKARRRVSDRRAFITDSDSKWAWREANCRDAACLGTWYATRIDELQQVLARMQRGSAASETASASASNTATPPHASAAAKRGQPERPDKPPMSTPSTADTAMLECTASHPGLVIGEQCPNVIRQNGSPWKYRAHGDDWFCGVATLERS
ncbi:lysozyme inhibitor LprI family protein [Burkholderia sp. WSM2232]|uniref:lysozyme inhibitor LprI family protein n=1 Tax=Burkholderia sp. WSM2232 TaxID=944436 RepID=UPI00041E2FE7|nr:hypothetical protein [Burkholderia sp. WSM2232]